MTFVCKLPECINTNSRILNMWAEIICLTLVPSLYLVRFMVSLRSRKPQHKGQVIGKTKMFVMFFSNIIKRISGHLISKFQVGLKSLLRHGLSEPEFYGDLVYKFKKIVDSNIFSAQFIKIVPHYKKIGYNINVLQQTACLVVNLITVGNFAFLFNCTPSGRTSDSMTVPT